MPVIHRNINGADEIILHNKNGFLFYDLDDLKILLIKVINKELTILDNKINYLPESFRLKNCIDLISKNIERVLDEKL